VAPSPDPSLRLGLVASESVRKEDVALAIPYDEQVGLTPDLATGVVYKDILPEEYDGWTGENGMLAMLLLNELARSDDSGGRGIPLPVRKPAAAELVASWVAALPSPAEMAAGKSHPLLWDEVEQEDLQSSSTKKLYRVLDDVDEDSDWLEENIWGSSEERFPEVVTMGGEEYECFTSEGFKWAMAIVTSRSIFVNDALRVIPYLDMANHDTIGVSEIQPAYMGTFGTTKGASLNAGSGRSYKKGEEIFCSYGPKSSAEYLLEHGFVPGSDDKDGLATCVSELTFEITEDDDIVGASEGEGQSSSSDSFYDDKLDILEFETYDSAPMEPIQTFDVIATSSGLAESSLDPAMIQFLRLAQLGGQDSFLLESVFRKEAWGFMSLPVSERNERDVLDAIADACSTALGEMVGGGVDEVDETKKTQRLCAVVREAERRALTRTLEFVKREKEALDLKEYYQERRLKDLGLDSDWNPDEDSMGYDMDDELGYGQVRAPGSLDW